MNARAAAGRPRCDRDRKTTPGGAGASRRGALRVPMGLARREPEPHREVCGALGHPVVGAGSYRRSTQVTASAASSGPACRATATVSSVAISKNGWRAAWPRARGGGGRGRRSRRGAARRWHGALLEGHDRGGRAADVRCAPRTVAAGQVAWLREVARTGPRQSKNRGGRRGERIEEPVGRATTSPGAGVAAAGTARATCSAAEPCQGRDASPCTCMHPQVEFGP